MLIEKNREEKQRFSIRKLSVGAASVLVGLAFTAYSGQTAQAAMESSRAPSAVKEETKQSHAQIAVQDASQATKPAESQNGGEKSLLKPIAP